MIDQGNPFATVLLTGQPEYLISVSEKLAESLTDTSNVT